MSEDSTSVAFTLLNLKFLHFLQIEKFHLLPFLIEQSANFYFFFTTVNFNAAQEVGKLLILILKSPVLSDNEINLIPALTR